MFKRVSKKRYRNLIEELRTKNLELNESKFLVNNFIRALKEKNVDIYDICGEIDSPEKIFERLIKLEVYNETKNKEREYTYILVEHEETIVKQEKEIKKLIRENNELHEYIRNHVNE